MIAKSIDLVDIAKHSGYTPVPKSQRYHTLKEDNYVMIKDWNDYKKYLVSKNQENHVDTRNHHTKAVTWR